MFRRLLPGLFLATLLILPAAAQKPPALGQPVAPAPAPIVPPQAPPPVAQPPVAQPGDKPLPGQPPVAQPPAVQPPVAQPPQPPQRPAQQPPQRPVPPAQAERSFTVTNNAPRTIFELYVFPDGQTDRGPDRLGADVLPAGRNYTVRLGRVTGCVFTIRAIYDNRQTEEQRGVNICQTQQVAFTGQGLPAETGTERTAEIINGADRTIMQVYVSPTTSREWLEDRLGADVLPAGQTYRVRWRGECQVDVRVIYDNQGAEERRNIDLCQIARLNVRPGWVTAENLSAPGGAPAPGVAAPGFSLVNRSGQEILQVFVFADGARNRGRDRLGADVLPDGRTYQVRHEDRGTACAFTLRIVYSGNTPDEERAGIDLCRTTEIVIQQGWVTAPLPTGPAVVAPTGPRPGQVPASFTLINNAGATIFTLFVFPDGGAQGPDRLGADTVSNGARYTVNLQGITACTVTVRATFTGGRQPVQQAGINICTASEVTVGAAGIVAGGQPPAVAPPAAPPGGPGQVPATLGVVNNSGATIFTLFVFADGTAAAGQDRLGADVINNGARYAVPLSGITTCLVTVRVTFTGGRPQEERRGVNVCQTAEITVAPGWQAAGAPGPAVQPQAPGQVPAGIVVVNNAGATIFTLFVFPDGATAQGPDRLGADTIANGARFTVPLQGITACTVTVRATFTGNRPPMQQAGVNICQPGELTVGPDGRITAGGQAPAPAPAPPPAAAPGQVPASFVLVNNSGATVFTVHVFAPGATAQGPDRLGADTVANGARFTVPLQGVTSCTVTVRVSFAGNRPVEERSGVDICQTRELTVAPGWTTAGAPRPAPPPGPPPGLRPPPGLEQGFVLVNNSGRTIFALYVFAEGAPGRGPDRLGADTIANGARFAVALPDRGNACRFTVRVVFTGGAPDEERAGIDLCTTREITIAPGWTQAGRTTFLRAA